MIKRVGHVKSKFLKTAVLLRDSRLKQYIPETCLFSSDSLQIMLKEYGIAI